MCTHKDPLQFDLLLCKGSEMSKVLDGHVPDIVLLIPLLARTEVSLDKIFPALYYLRSSYHIYFLDLQRYPHEENNIVFQLITRKITWNHIDVHYLIL
jgi:hypothetical protein